MLQPGGLTPVLYITGTHPQWSDSCTVHHGYAPVCFAPSLNDITSVYVFDSYHKDIAELPDKDKYTKIDLCLTEEEIEYLRNPLPATKLEKESI